MDYTGGDTISHFDVKFRQRNSSQWSNRQKVKVHDGGRMGQGLLWYGIVTNYSLGKPSELSVEVVNDANERSSSLTKAEVLGESLPIIGERTNVATWFYEFCKVAML